jgi:hypothetical protein
MIRELTYSSMRMGLYDPVKQILAPNALTKDDYTLAQKIAAGAISGGTGSAFVNPMDLLKVSAINKVFKNFVDSISKCRSGSTETI